MSAKYREAFTRALLCQPPNSPSRPTDNTCTTAATNLLNRCPEFQKGTFLVTFCYAAAATWALSWRGSWMAGERVEPAQTEGAKPFRIQFHCFPGRKSGGGAVLWNLPLASLLLATPTHWEPVFAGSIPVLCPNHWKTLKAPRFLGGVSCVCCKSCCLSYKLTKISAKPEEIARKFCIFTTTKNLLKVGFRQKSQSTEGRQGGLLAPPPSYIQPPPSYISTRVWTGANERGLEKSESPQISTKYLNLTEVDCDSFASGWKNQTSLWYV